jgi:hypothetical protein
MSHRPPLPRSYGFAYRIPGCEGVYSIEHKSREFIEKLWNLGIQAGYDCTPVRTILGPPELSPKAPRDMAIMS